MALAGYHLFLYDPLLHHDVIDILPQSVADIGKGQRQVIDGTTYVLRGQRDCRGYSRGVLTHLQSFVKKNHTHICTAEQIFYIVMELHELLYFILMFAIHSLKLFINGTQFFMGSL